MLDQSLATQNQQEKDLSKIRNFLFSPEVKERFTDMMGNDGLFYLNQVLTLVADSEDLQKCTPKSILVSAMRAASLKLSLDPSQGQAYIIPYSGQARYQTGYKGVYELAMRTNLYRYINVFPIYAGEEIIENRMTGNHTLGGKRTGDTVIAWMLYFQLFGGFEKTFYMTVDEIEAHARKYSRAYQYDLSKNRHGSKWSDPDERAKMERKTVLSNGLRKHGRFNPGDQHILEQIEDEQGWIDREDYPDELIEAGDQPVEQPVEPTMQAVVESMDKAPMTYEEACKITNGDGKKLLIEIPADKLQFMAQKLGQNPNPTPAQDTELLAIQIILKHTQQGAAQDRLI